MDGMPRGFLAPSTFTLTPATGGVDAGRVATPDSAPVSSPDMFPGGFGPVVCRNHTSSPPRLHAVPYQLCFSILPVPHSTVRTPARPRPRVFAEPLPTTPAAWLSAVLLRRSHLCVRGSEVHGRAVRVQGHGRRGVSAEAVRSRRVSQIPQSCIVYAVASGVRRVGALGGRGAGTHYSQTVR